MVYVQRGNLLQSSLFVIQFLLNMTRDVFISTRCNISTRQKWTEQFDKIEVYALLYSIYKTESSDLVYNLSGMDYTNCQEEKSPQRCSGSEHGTARHRNNRVSVFLSF